MLINLISLEEDRQNPRPALFPHLIFNWFSIYKAFFNINAIGFYVCKSIASCMLFILIIISNINAIILAYMEILKNKDLYYFMLYNNKSAIL